MGMKIQAYLITGFLFIACATFAQDDNEYFWIRFTDKQGTEYSVDQPETFYPNGLLNDGTNKELKLMKQTCRFQKYI